MSTAQGDRRINLAATRAALYALPLNEYFELPGRPHVIYSIRSYSGWPDAAEAAKCARIDVPFLFKAFETGQIGPKRLSKIHGGKPRMATIHEYLDWTVTAQSATADDELDFGGFRIVVVLPRYRSSWPAPGAYDMEGEKKHPSLGAAGLPLPPLQANGKPMSAATVRSGPGYLEVPFVATQETKRGRGYCRCLVEAIEDIARACKLPKLLLCSTNDPAVKSTWRHLGFDFAMEEDMEQWDIRHTDLVHLQNTAQMHKDVPQPKQFRPLVIRHAEYVQRTYIQLGKRTAACEPPLCTATNRRRGRPSNTSGRRNSAAAALTTTPSGTVAMNEPLSRLHSGSVAMGSLDDEMCRPLQRRRPSSSRASSFNGGGSSLAGQASASYGGPTVSSCMEGEGMHGPTVSSCRMEAAAERRIEEAEEEAQSVEEQQQRAEERRRSLVASISAVWDEVAASSAMADDDAPDPPADAPRHPDQGRWFVADAVSSEVQPVAVPPCGIGVELAAATGALQAPAGHALFAPSTAMPGAGTNLQIGLAPTVQPGQGDQPSCQSAHSASPYGDVQPAGGGAAVAPAVQPPSAAIDGAPSPLPADNKVADAAAEQAEVTAAAAAAPQHTAAVPNSPGRAVVEQPAGQVVVVDLARSAAAMPPPTPPQVGCRDIAGGSRPRVETVVDMHTLLPTTTAQNMAILAPSVAVAQSAAPSAIEQLPRLVTACEQASLSQESQQGTGFDRADQGGGASRDPHSQEQPVVGTHIVGRTEEMALQHATDSPMPGASPTQQS